MYRITASFDVTGITPEQAVSWWLAMDNGTYTSWHRDHKAWQWHCREKQIVRQGDTVVFHETIGRFNLKVKAKLAELDTSGYLKFELIGAPGSFAFRYESSGKATRVTYDATLGFSSFPGRLLDGMIKKLYPPDEYGRAITEHVKEEHQLIVQRP